MGGPALVGDTNPIVNTYDLENPMNREGDASTYPVEEAVKAQKALRAAAGLEPEQFPIQAFVGMISDEIEALRAQRLSDKQISKLIEDNSTIRISAQEITSNYASPEDRGH
jgi:hypothetical protein